MDWLIYIVAGGVFVFMGIAFYKSERKERSPEQIREDRMNRNHSAGDPSPVFSVGMILIGAFFVLSGIISLVFS